MAIVGRTVAVTSPELILLLPVFPR